MAIILAFINIGLYTHWTKEHVLAHDAKYIFSHFVFKGSVALNYMSIYLIVNQFVPLDLLITIEISKLIYTNVMEQDAEMMVADYDLKDVQGFKANHLGLHEELSRVEYIFCDKTGTLTQNELVFRALSLGNGHK